MEVVYRSGGWEGTDPQCIVQVKKKISINTQGSLVRELRWAEEKTIHLSAALLS